MTAQLVSTFAATGPAKAERVPPQDLDAEAAVLSAILLEPHTVDLVIGILRPEHFYSESNRRIYEAALWLLGERKPIDTVTVKGRLADTDRLVQVGGSAYLAALVDAVPAVAHIETYAHRVKEKWRRQNLIHICTKTIAEAYDPRASTAGLIDGHEQQVFDLAHIQSRSGDESIGPVTRRVFAELTEAAQRGERLTGIPTGFERIDGKTAGLHGGELTIVAARPGMGKTSWVLNVATSVASLVTETEDRGAQYLHGVMIFSLEMPREQLALRMVCSEGSVDLGKVRQGYLQEADWDRITQATTFVYGLPVWLDDPSTISPRAIQGAVRKRQAECDRGGSGVKIRLVIVDYLQLMTGDENSQSREQEISSISRGLKQLSKELRVPVIALSQLNRAVETRGKDKRPQLSDLRESGAIEQDADNIIFIYREDYYDQESQQKGIAELIVAKQRNGPTGPVKVKFNAAYTRFDNLAPGVHDEAYEQ